MTETINTHSLLADLQTRFPNAVISSSSTYGIETAIITMESLLPMVNYLNGPAGYTYLVDLCGVHYPHNTPAQIGVVYHLMNMVQNTKIRLKVLVADSAEPHIPTLTGTFSAANWMERETYDFFGIKFDGHPDLRRILNEDSMTYFPMRKEYPLEESTRTDKSDVMFGR